MNVEVDVQVDEAPARKVLRVTRCGKVLLAVVPRTNTQRLTAVDAQFLRGRRNLKPANVAAVAVILRFQILRLVCRERSAILPYEGRTLAVGIVLPRTATVITDVHHICRQPETHAKLRNHRNVVACGTIVGIHLYLPVARNGVCHRVVGTYGKRHLGRNDDSLAGLLRFNALHDALLCCVFPHTQTLFKARSLLVVVNRFPEVGLKRCGQHLRAVGQPTDQSARLVDCYRAVFCSHDDVPVAILHFSACAFQLSGERVWLQHKLFACHNKARFCPRSCAFQVCRDIQQRLAAEAQGVTGDVVVGKRGERVAVDYSDVVALAYKLQRLIHMLHLVVVRMWSAVGRQQTVKAEGAHVGLVAEVAAVEKSALQTFPRR